MAIFRDTEGVEWRYHEHDPIGDGGMGEVFRGAAADGRLVAVKRVRLRRSRDNAKRRLREIEIGGRLVQASAAGLITNHLVVPLGHAFVGDDLLIVMPMADESLQGALTKSMFDVPGGLAVVRDVTAGLIELAALPILHRDLKPANVLRFGSVWKLSDFGLSRDLDEDTASFTFRGAGTYAFMAPEIWKFQPATFRSDLYALGVLAYQVFTGALPFPGPDEARYREQHRAVAPPHPDCLPPQLARLLLRLLRKNPAERPQSAAAVAEVLDGLTAPLPAAQEPVAASAAALEARLAEAEARQANGADTERLSEETVALARAELGDLLADAHDLLRKTLPDARLDAAAYALILGPVVVTFAAAEPPVLSRHQIKIFPRTVLVGTVAGSQIFCEQEQTGDLRWRYAKSFLDEHRHPLTAAAIVEVFRAAIDSYGRAPA